MKVDDEASGTLPCIDNPRCVVEYGASPLDIARFGVLPHCKNLFQARCVAYLDHHQELVDFRLKTYHHDSHSAPTTIDDILTLRGISGKPARIYVNRNGTLVVDGGSPVVVLPEARQPAPPRTPEGGPSVVRGQQEATTPRGFPTDLPHRQNLSPPKKDEENQQVSAAKSVYKLFNALQAFTQAVVSNDQAQSVQLETRIDGNKPVLLLNATRNDFLNLLLSLSKFDLVTLKK